MITAERASKITHEAKEALRNKKDRKFKYYLRHAEERICKVACNGESSIHLYTEEFDRELEYDCVPKHIIEELKKLGYDVVEGSYRQKTYLFISWENG